MIIEEQFRFPGSPTTVAGALLDVDRIKSCVPGLESVSEISPDEYEATLAVRLGPMSASFVGSVEIDRSGAPEVLRASGSGRDRKTGSRAEVEFTARLEHAADGTLVSTLTDLTIRGRLGQFGAGVITSTGREMIREFARCASETLEASAEATEDGLSTASGLGAGEGKLASTPSLVRVVLRGVLTYFSGAIQALGETVRRLFRSGRSR